MKSSDGDVVMTVSCQCQVGTEIDTRCQQLSYLSHVTQHLMLATYDKIQGATSNATSIFQRPPG